MGGVEPQAEAGGGMNTAFSLMAAGVRVVPEAQRAKPDLFLACFVLLFFAYLAWLLASNMDREP